MVDANVKILKYLKEKGANLSISNKYKCTLIHEAARNGAFEVLRYLVEDCKMDVNVSDVNGNLPVHMISMRDYNIDIFKYLKDKGANLSIANKAKCTLIHKAARNGAFEVLRYLVEDCKMDVNVSDVNENLPIHMISMSDYNIDIFKYLKDKGANLSLSNKYKCTLIHEAARNGAFEVLRYLVEDCKMDVNVSDVNGNLPVHMISMRDYNIDIFKYLKDKGANISISNKDKRTLIHEAARNGALDVLRYLVEDCKM
ncbi:ankyrin repeat domain-containing protein 1-like [Diabrotica virgifera virgifera]|uniref:Ankyrin n=1 Tax=Diabrotica virgifera virgifera TaxID=50390 RepID=A0ABM5KFC3_DIAVI|nr:ankyrin repeat domain-containing protein 1-like [Diabrotica virgifera virgifera]